MGATIACTVLAFVTYIVRMYVRAFTVKALGLDDAFMTLAMMVVSRIELSEKEHPLTIASVHRIVSAHHRLSPVRRGPAVSITYMMLGNLPN